PDYGLTEEQLNEYWLKFDLERSVPYFLPISLGQVVSSLETIGQAERLSTVQIGVGVASLLNSGHRVTPWLLNALYDHTEKHFFIRDVSANLRERIISPASGIKLRRELLQNSRYSDEHGFLFVNSGTAVSNLRGMSVHHIQELLLASAPKTRPEVLLVVAVEYGSLFPQPPKSESTQGIERLEEIGQRLLQTLADYGEPAESLTEAPAEKSALNMRRYFFSRRLSTPNPKKKYEHVPTMPQLTGLSLRKGLQLLNLYDIQIRIRGSGRIVSQKPAAGEPLTETKTCELFLETGI
ncbi:MAG: hypothetical protein D3924_09145, partial [Candidatus Electrothrix sp. AR4]|nr:hypothetical protein [Candidatus Electrothrix sp. AR4]